MIFLWKCISFVLIRGSRENVCVFRAGQRADHEFFIRKPFKHLHVLELMRLSGLFLLGLSPASSAKLSVLLNQKTLKVLTTCNLIKTYDRSGSFIKEV